MIVISRYPWTLSHICFTVLAIFLSYCGPEGISVPSFSNYQHIIILSAAKHRKSRSAQLRSQSQCLHFLCCYWRQGSVALVAWFIRISNTPWHTNSLLSADQVLWKIYMHAPLWQWVALSVPSYGRTFQLQGYGHVLANSFYCSFSFWCILDV